MFAFYQNFNARREESELQREAESTGHDRFCQQRPGGGRRKRRGLMANGRRTQSAIEIECDAGGGEAFASVRSVLLGKEKSASIEEDESPGARRRRQLLHHHQQQQDDDPRGYYQLSSKIDSLAKILFNRVYAVKGGKDHQAESTRNNGRQQYMALEQHHQHRLGGGVGEGAAAPTKSSSPSSCDNGTATLAGAAVESLEMEKRSRDRALSICRIYTRETPRYSLLKHLNNVGSRVDKHWFVVRDTLLKTDRLLALAPLSRNCVLSVSPLARDVLNKLFLTLQHPYICPVLDLEFVKHEGQDHVVLVQPINQGSLKDIIYGVTCCLK